tara:strand:+ start:20046 stop:20345 length:300 start_codon:yes stop_codon:yes gene_type:complete
MMIWEDDEDGRTQTVYNEQGVVFATITENEKEWIFDLGVGNQELRLSKEDLEDPFTWIQVYIGAVIIEDEGDSELPFLHFIDDETKAVWQVWDVIDGES